MNAYALAYFGVVGGLALISGIAYAWLELCERRRRKARELAAIREELRGMRSAMRVSLAAHQARQQIIAAQQYGADAADERWSL